MNTNQPSHQTNGFETPQTIALRRVWCQKTPRALVHFVDGPHELYTGVKRFWEAERWNWWRKSKSYSERRQKNSKAVHAACLWHGQYTRWEKEASVRQNGS